MKYRNERFKTQIQIENAVGDSILGKSVLWHMHLICFRIALSVSFGWGFFGYEACRTKRDVLFIPYYNWSLFSRTHRVSKISILKIMGFLKCIKCSEVAIVEELG